METAEKTLEMLEKNPIVMKIKAEHDFEVIKTREAAGARIEAINAEADRVIPELEKEVDALAVALVEHDEKRKAIQERIATARATLYQKRIDLDGERSQAEAVLLENYDPRIDEAIQFFRDKYNTLRTKKADVTTHRGATNPAALTKELLNYTNTPAINGALTYTRTAVEVLERMKLDPVLDMERVAALKRGIPSADILTEYSTNKPLEGSKMVDPLHLLPSDEQLDWSLRGINEKFKKLMGRP